MIEVQKRLIKIIGTDVLLNLIQTCFFAPEYTHLLVELVDELERRDKKDRERYCYKFKE